MLAIGRGAAGLGRDQPRAGDALVAHLIAADGKRRDCALDRSIADAAGRRDALAEPDNAREGIDDSETVAGGARDEKTAIIGAEIERGIGRAAPIAAWGAVKPSGRPPTPIGPL